MSRPGRPPRSTAGAGLAPWRVGAALAASVAGLGVSIYLTVAHFDRSVTLACADNGVVNCAKVTQSAFSEVLGVPVAVLGLVFFAAMVALNVPAAWRAGARELHQARLVLAVCGVVAVFYLVGAELFGVGAICLWCSAVHVLTVALYTLVVTGTATRNRRSAYRPAPARPRR